MTRTRLLRKAWWPIRATAAADIAIRLKLLELNLPAAVEKFVTVGPGQSAVIVTPVPRNSSATASLRERTNAFVAKYSAMPGPGWKAAVEPTLSTPPRRLEIMPGKKSRVR